MANEKHIEWLLEGVEAWNARREREEFVPDFTSADLKSIHLNGGAVVRRGGIGTSGQSHHVNFQQAILTKANLSECILSNGKLNYANMSGAIIRGGLYDHTDFRGAVTTDVDACTKFYTGRPNEPTDLGNALNLTQHQLNSMKGDSGTIIPEGLERPEHWPELEEDTTPNDEDDGTPDMQAAKASAHRQPTEENSADADSEPFEAAQAPRATQISPSQTAKKLVANRAPIAMTGATLLELIAAYRDEVRKNNQLSVEHPEFRDNLLAFLDELSNTVTHILDAVPEAVKDTSDDKVEEATTWTDRFINSAVPAWKDHLDPDKLGKASAPVGIILTCGTFGYLISGFNPLGFGAGAVVGKWATGEMKSGAAADKLAEQLERPDD